MSAKKPAQICLNTVETFFGSDQIGEDSSVRRIGMALMCTWKTPHSSKRNVQRVHALSDLPHLLSLCAVPFVDSYYPHLFHFMSANSSRTVHISPQYSHFAL